MSTSPINSFSTTNNYVQNILNTTLENAGVSTQSNSGLSGITTPSISDNGQLSPFAQVLSTLQQLQQNDPTQYQQLTQQIATNLDSAAQTASSQGNTGAASELTTLANDFTTASQNNQLPNIQDLANAIGGGHHHHHHAHAASSDSDTDSSSSTSGTQSLSQLLASLQQNSTQSQSSSLNPLNIILNTLNNAGVLGTNG